MKQATKGLLSFVTAFLIVFSTFGNAYFVAEASELAPTEITVDADADAVEVVDAAAESVSTEDSQP